MHHWLLILYTGFDKSKIARVGILYRFRTIKEIAQVLDSTTTIVPSTVHKPILPRNNLRPCDIRKVDFKPPADRLAVSWRLLGQLHGALL